METSRIIENLNSLLPEAERFNIMASGEALDKLCNKCFNVSQVKMIFGTYYYAAKDSLKKVYELMELYPQSGMRRPSVEFIPTPYAPVDKNAALAVVEEELETTIVQTLDENERKHINTYVLNSASQAAAGKPEHGHEHTG
jgi:hypothetical protein